MSYTVVFNSNGGDDTSIITFSQTIQEGVPTKLEKRPGAFYRTGYKFVGWGTTIFATVPTYSDEEEVTDIAGSGGTITLYAVWRTDTIWDIMFGIASSFSALKDKSLSPAPPLEYDTLFHTMGWCCDRASVVYDKDTYLGQSEDRWGTRNFYKQTDGFAIAIYANPQTPYYGPSLFSTNPDNVTYYYDDNVLTYDHTFTFNGKTWYYNGAHHSQGTGLGNVRKFASFSIDDNDSARMGILTALGVRYTPYASSSNFYKGFEIGKALCNPARGS